SSVDGRSSWPAVAVSSAKPISSDGGFRTAVDPSWSCWSAGPSTRVVRSDLSPRPLMPMPAAFPRCACPPVASCAELNLSVCPEARSAVECLYADGRLAEDRDHVDGSLLGLQPPAARVGQD